MFHASAFRRSMQDYLYSLPDVFAVFICWRKHLTPWVPSTIFPELYDPLWYWKSGLVPICPEDGCFARTVMVALFRPRSSEKGELFSENPKAMETELRLEHKDATLTVDRDQRNEFWDLAYGITIWDPAIEAIARPHTRP